MKEVKKLIGTSLGLFDSGCHNGSSVIANKVIDVSNLCKDTKRAVVKYADVKRGRIAQICNGTGLGMHVHYHINEMTPTSLAKDEVFDKVCIIHLGCNALELANVIFDNQPETL